MKSRFLDVLCAIGDAVLVVSLLALMIYLMN